MGNERTTIPGAKSQREAANIADMQLTVNDKCLLPDPFIFAKNQSHEVFIVPVVRCVLIRGMSEKGYGLQLFSK